MAVIVTAVAYFAVVAAPVSAIEFVVVPVETDKDWLALDEYPATEYVIVTDPTVLSCKPEKVATPEEDVAVAVEEPDEKVPLERVAVTVTPEVEILFPPESFSWMTGWVVNAACAAAPEAEVVIDNVEPLPAVTVTVAVAIVNPPAPV